MKVHLREKKLRKKGLISLYLEYYKSSFTDRNGKTKVNREFEFLEIYLYQNPKNKQERDRNNELRGFAETVRAKREVEDKTQKEGIINKSKQKANFYEYLKSLAESKTESKGNKGAWFGVVKQFENFAGDHVSFQEIDKKFCEEFKAFLTYEAKTKSGNNLKVNSRIGYFNKFRATLKQAIRDGIISENPTMDVNMPKEQTVERQFLTDEEIKTLSNTPCRYDVLKNAFLFSCLTGLRWSDIQKLTWKEVKDRPDGYFIHFRQQKTSGFEYHPINESARKFLGKAGEPEERVFKGLKYSAHMNLALKQWILRAGITKEITFHCGRHTFAVNFLSNGGDIYTLSKFLGHSELKTTEIYADIVPKKKQDSLAYTPTI